MTSLPSADLLSLLPARLSTATTQNLAALLDHVRVQLGRARQVRSHHGNGNGGPHGVPLGRCGPGGDEQLPQLAGDADGVEDEEAAVAHPAQRGGLDPGAERQGEEEVAHDLGDGPGQQHGRVGRAGGDEGVEVDGAPDEGEAGGDLHQGREEGGADDAC